MEYVSAFFYTLMFVILGAVHIVGGLPGRGPLLFRKHSNLAETVILRIIALIALYFPIHHYLVSGDRPEMLSFSLWAVPLAYLVGFFLTWKMWRDGAMKENTVTTKAP